MAIRQILLGGKVAYILKNYLPVFFQLFVMSAEYL